MDPPCGGRGTNESRVFQAQKKIRENRLSLANLRLEQRASDDDFLEMARFEYKGPVIEDDSISPKRIILVHEESLDEPLHETN